MTKRTPSLALLPVLLALMSGCGSRDRAPEVMALNLYDHEVDMAVSDSAGKELFETTIRPFASSTARELFGPGYYRIAWRIAGQEAWQGNTADRVFPSLAGGPCLLEKNTLHCILADETGVIRVLQLDLPSDYGAKVCVVNATNLSMDEMSFIDEAGNTVASDELAATPPGCVTAFVDVLPGEFSCHAAFSDISGNKSAASLEGPIDFGDNTCHLLLAFRDKGELRMRHFVTGTGPRVLVGDGAKARP